MICYGGKDQHTFSLILSQGKTIIILAHVKGS
jgi:hypothetical protein